MVTLRNRTGIFLPKNLALGDIIKDNPPKFPYYEDYFKYMIHIILDRTSFSSQFSSRAYVPLHSQILRSVISNYHQYKKYLIDNGIIECNELYIRGYISKGYRLCNAYQTEVIKDYIIKPKIVKRIEKATKSLNSDVIRKYSNLIKWFDGLEIDFHKAHIYREKLFNNNLLEMTEVEAINKDNSYRMMIDRIQNKDYFFVVDDTGNRFYSVLCNIKKEFRNFITYKGQRLLSIDLKCSQPYISTILLNLDFYKNKLNDKITYNIFNEDIKKKIKRISEKIIENKNPKYVKCLDITDRQHISQISPDAEKYIELVEGGSLYEYMGEKINSLMCYADSYLERSEIKKLMLTIIFHDHKDNMEYFKSLRNLFIQIFPSVYEIFNLIKEDNYKLLAIILQKIESTIFLDRISRRISKEFPCIPIFTIHDCICTMAAHEDTVRLVMQEELFKAIGIHPTLSVEHWFPSEVTYDDFEIVL